MAYLPTCALSPNAEINRGGEDVKATTACERGSCISLLLTRMVVDGQLVEPAVCLSDLYDIFLLDIVRDTRQNLWTMVYRSQ